MPVVLKMFLLALEPKPTNSVVNFSRFTSIKILKLVNRNFTSDKFVVWHFKNRRPFGQPKNHFTNVNC